MNRCEKGTDYCCSTAKLNMPYIVATQNESSKIRLKTIFLAFLAVYLVKVFTFFFPNVRFQ